MRRQPLHESHGGSVMTRRPRRRAQISRCYHSLPPPSPSAPPTTPTPTPTKQLPPLLSSPPIVEDHHHQLLLSNRDSLTTSGSWPPSEHSAVERPVYWSYRTPHKDRLPSVPSHRNHDCKTFKTSLFGRPFESSNVLTQVGKLPLWKLLLLFLIVNLLTRPAMCKPWIDEQPDKVTFRSRICQPVSAADLRRRMGTAFDDAKMAADMSSAKSLFGDDVMSSWDKDMDGYQSDGPAAVGSGLRTDSSSLVEAERFLTSGEMYLREEEMVYGRRRNDGMMEEDREEVDIDFDVDNGRVEEREEIDVDVKDKDVDVERKTTFGRRSWLPRRKILNSHNKDGARGRSSVYKDFESIEKVDLDRENRNDIDSYKYMRRRRRRRSLESRDASDDFRSQFRDRSRKTRKSNTRKSNRKESSSNLRESSRKHNNLLHLRISLSGKSGNTKKLRKQLKKEFRQQNRKLNKPPPWQCKMYHKAVFMKKDVFPRVLIDGRCGTDKCFYRLYNCEPNKYAIKLLQRDENHCNPLPIVGNTTIYEERWNIITRHITVGCNCASLVANGKGKNRRKI